MPVGRGRAAANFTKMTIESRHRSITDLQRNVEDGAIRSPQQGTGDRDARAMYVLHGRHPHGGMKPAAQCCRVHKGHGGQLLNGHLLGIVNTDILKQRLQLPQ